MSAENIQIVKKFFDAVPGGDRSGMRALLDENVEWIEPDVPALWFSGTHHGAEAALKEVVDPSFDNVDDFGLTIDEYLDAGDEIIAVGRFHGNAKATGKEFSVPSCFISTVRSGIIVRFRAYHNTAKWLEVLGQPVS